MYLWLRNFLSIMILTVNISIYIDCYMSLSYISLCYSVCISISLLISEYYVYNWKVLTTSTLINHDMYNTNSNVYTYYYCENCV